MKLEVFAAIYLMAVHRDMDVIGVFNNGRKAVIHALISTYNLDRKEIADEIRAMRNKQRAAA